MKLFLARYFKITFTYLRLHVIFGLFKTVFLNAYYLTRFSAWAVQQRHVQHNDFPSRWDYNKRFTLYQQVFEMEGLANIPINYMEFGVAQGASFRWMLQQNAHADSRFHGFDTFTGLPEDWGPFKKGYFDNHSEPPQINDQRGSFHQGLFQQTLPPFLKTLNSNARNVIMLDADLYSSTLYVLTSLAPYLKKGDLIFFDEFAVPTHEFKAYLDFVQSYYVEMELIGAANNYYFVAFKLR